jgi:hypothetical protein
MTLSTPHPRNSLYVRSFADTRLSSTFGVTMTANNQAHSVSSTFTTLLSSTTYDTNLISIAVQNTGVNNTNTNQLLHIYIGADGAEQVLIPSIATGWAFVDNRSMKTYEFPLSIPAGSRLSAKLQAAVASDLCYVLVDLRRGPGWAGSSVEAIGVNLASSCGTLVTAGTTSELTGTDIGTTVNQWSYVLPCIQGGTTDTALASNEVVELDILTGNEVYRDLWGIWYDKNAAVEAVFKSHAPGGFYTRVPSGTTLQARIQESNATADGPYDVIIYGVY